MIHTLLSIIRNLKNFDLSDSNFMNRIYNMPNHAKDNIRTNSILNGDQI